MSISAVLPAVLAEYRDPAVCSPTDDGRLRWYWSIEQRSWFPLEAPCERCHHVRVLYFAVGSRREGWCGSCLSVLWGIVVPLIPPTS